MRRSRCAIFRRSGAAGRLSSQPVQGGVELGGQRLLVLAEGDGVVAGAQSAGPTNFSFGIGLGVVDGDRQVQQHGVEPAQLQVDVGLDLVAVDLLA